jgi:hypothetical protein
LIASLPGELLFASLLLKMFLEMQVLLGCFCVFAVAGLLLLFAGFVPAAEKLLLLASLSFYSLLLASLHLLFSWLLRVTVQSLLLLFKTTAITFSKSSMYRILQVQPLSATNNKL